MAIKAKSIRSLTKLLKAAGDKKELILGISLSKLSEDQWVRLGFSRIAVLGECIIPSIIGKTTKFNASGKEEIRKDLPKVDKTFSYWGETRDWHGGIHSNMINQTRKVYQKEYISAPSELLYIANIEDQLSIVTGTVTLNEDEEVRNLHVCNMMLECFGEFDLIDPNTCTKVIELKLVQWEILPKGRYPWAQSKEIIKSYISNLDKSKKSTIEYRVKTITNKTPDFLAVGRGGFSGYFVYGFSSKNLYVLESLHLDNATYIFADDWAAFSQLTKNEIIEEGLAEHRVIHDKYWEPRLRAILR